MSQSLDDKIEPLNRKTWKEYLVCSGDVRMMLGYMDATDHIASELERIRTQTSSYEELKKELLAFQKDREKFTSVIQDHWDEKKGTFKLSSNKFFEP